MTGTTSGIPGGLKKAATTVSGKLSTKKARVAAAAVTGTVVLAAGTLTAVGVHAADVSSHKKQVAAQELTVRLTAEKAAADKAATDKAAADQAAADQAAKAAADKAAADAAAKAAADKAAADKAAADKAAADKAAADRAAAAAQANRDAQRAPITPSPTKTPTKAPTSAPTTSQAPVAAYGSPQAIAQSIVPAGQFSCFSTIIQRESGWNIHASNPSSGAYGLPQALPGSKMASAGPDWQNNPETQIRWALSYMDSRYGSPCGALSFWNGHGWY